MAENMNIYQEKEARSRINARLMNLDLSYEIKSDLLHLIQDALKGTFFASGSFVFFKLFLPLVGVIFTEVALSGMQIYAAIAGSMIFVLLKLHTPLKLLRPYFTFAMTIWQFSVLRGLFEIHKDLDLVGLVGLSLLAFIFLYLSHRYDLRLKGRYLKCRSYLEQELKDFFEESDEYSSQKVSKSVTIKELNQKSDVRAAELEAMLEARFGPVSFIKDLDLENLENINTSEDLPVSSSELVQMVKIEETAVEKFKGETYKEAVSEVYETIETDVVEKEVHQPDPWIDSPDETEFDEDFYHDSFDDYDEDLERERALKASKRRVRNTR